MYKFSKKTMLKRSNDTFKDFDVLNLIGNGVFLAGGAFRHIFNKDDSISDFDVFFSDLKLKEQVMDKLENVYFAKKVFTCPEGKLHTYRLDEMKIQLITERAYPSIEDMLDTFDINACRFGFDGKYLIAPKEAIRDTKKKRITINRLDFPNASFKRLLKYRDKGYYLPNSTIEEFLMSVWLKGSRGEEIDGRFYID